jgi:ribonuclease E
MGNKMLIDATHPEETRVVVLRGNRVEEFDYESASKKQLRGNIYLAKVTRVEPSLQAAFVNYGGNRHGFLAFSEIHPDYYQLPMAERQALKQEEERDSKAGADDPDDEERTSADAEGDFDDEDGDEASLDDRLDDESSAVEAAPSDTEDFSSEDDEDPRHQTAALEAALPATRYSARQTDRDKHSDDSDDSPADAAEASAGDSPTNAELPSEHGSGRRKTARHADRENGDANGDGEEAADIDHVESVGSEDALEELPQRARRRRRTYKIQEVIKRGQILLVQVVKEERGNKGAALTSYLSLAGRYTVLMPNTGSGGGISRKISSPGDRKRLREIAGELDVPDDMGLIIRTAGAARTKTEIKRDYEYLLRLWENVRDLTLKSTAPCLVYEEGDLIKRSIRDLYNREIDEVLVAGDDAYRDAKDFMRMLMPSHAKNVQPYKDPEPLFTRYEVERQLNAMFSPQVTLPSGGYIIINQTEALVAIDVNSGKSTREFSIEDTALKTNLEAAEEIARQLRLRDLAGLIVADFIDMEEKRNNRAVERKLKECLRSDRARIQVGRISHFGLLEMSRQRIRTGMVEGSTTQCAHCQGTGVVRSTESVALSVLRSLEDWLRTNAPCDLNAVASTEVSLYILNQKRAYLRDIEARHGVTLSVTASERMHGANFYIEKVAIAAPAAGATSAAVSQADRIIVPFESDAGEASDDQNRRSRRRRRRRRGREDQDGHESATASAGEETADADAEAEDSRPSRASRADAEEGGDNGKARRRSRRRGRRGGRNQRSARGGQAADRIETAAAEETGQADSSDEISAVKGEPVQEPSQDAPSAPASEGTADAGSPSPVETRQESADENGPEAQPASRSFRSSEGRSRAKRANGTADANGQDHGGSPEERGGARLDPDQKAETALDKQPKPATSKPRGTKRGWWQRRAYGE